MGYSTSTTTLEKMLPHLEELSNGKPCEWKVRGMTPFKFAYKVREALYIAQLHEEEYPALAEAARRFNIKVQRDKVVAILSDNPDVATIEVDTSTLGEAEAHSASQTLVVHGGQTDMTIIEKWIDSKRDVISFPDAVLSEEGLLRLYRWAKGRDLLMFVSKPGITVQKAQDDLRELAWTPEDLK